MRIADPEQLAALRAEWRRAYLGDGLRVLVGTATCGLAAGAQEVVERLRAEFKRRHVPATVVETGCIGAGMRFSKSIQTRLSLRQSYWRQTCGRLLWMVQPRVCGSEWVQ